MDEWCNRKACVRAAFELIASQTNLSVTFAYQTANVEDAPDAAVEVGSAQTTDGMNYGSLTDISSNSNSKQLIRFGWNVQNTSAAALIVGMCGGAVDYDNCG